ncbi:phytanoyl-CoA dioxygenase family protein [Micromonospora zhanjiangensis]|uniref:Phytanoyl-CoA dioxygenase (PhyH) n=1 Tax=Micromonospora zhanjiangensis TaxID=1522057 RepID=A0ABV8KLT8_9ACTN
MTVVYVDSPLPDDERRRRLYAGDLFVHGPTPNSLALAAFAREMAEFAFAPHFPPDAQHHLGATGYVEVLAGLKPAFINHPRSKDLVRGVLADLGLDPAHSYFDVPRLRTMTSDYLNAGLTLQFAAHRDTWFAAPMCQLNFWLPVYEVAEANVMAFHPRYFDAGVRNSSRDYDYAEWVANGRVAAARQVEVETRKQPRLEEELDTVPDLRVITPPGGVLIFSGAQLHSTVPNTSGRTRFSIDFRVVDRRDVERGRGARNVDSECTGTTLGDFRSAADLSPLPADLVAAHTRRTAEPMPLSPS